MKKNPDGTTWREWPRNKTFRKILNFDSMRKDKRGQNNTSTQGNDLPREFLCPTDKISIDENNSKSGVLTSYAYNMTDFFWTNAWGEQMDAVYIERGTWAGQINSNYGHKMNTISLPGAKMAFIDGIDWWTNWYGGDYGRGWDKNGQRSISFYKEKITPAVHGPVFYRHSQGAVVGFYDGHTKYMKKQDIFVKADRVAAYSNQNRPGMWSANKDWYKANGYR